MTTEDVSIHPDRPVGGRPRPAEKHRGPVTLRCRRIQTSATDHRLPDSRGSSDPDRSRVLRIGSESVEGFGMLAVRATAEAQSREGSEPGDRSVP
ncbi:MAG TPA: hypothetical protein VFR74_13960 [Jiangellales bacterium]|nr:hypothetical protein [Jiangellales bacterium]